MDPTRSLTDMKNFWGSNTYVPRTIRSEIEAIRQPELAYTDREHVTNRDPDSLSRLEQYRKAVINFRRYHCFYTDTGKDAIAFTHGSRGCFAMYVDALARVAPEELLRMTYVPYAKKNMARTCLSTVLMPSRQ